jgi:uncharacterized membrane protein
MLLVDKWWDKSKDILNVLGDVCVRWVKVKWSYHKEIVKIELFQDSETNALGFVKETNIFHH